tara:strand:- start:19257 stop:32756 length:13500 start_codon:yes stop_codon:yes gene_type:complete
MAGFVDNNAGDVEFVATNEAGEEFFPLPDTKKTVDYEYEPSEELLGMRDQMTKTFVQEDGRFAQLTHESPIHFLGDDGAWTDIDLDIQATAYGWEVMDNTFTTQFAAEMANGVAVQVNQFVDPIIVGINPTLMTIDETGTAPQPYMAAPSTKEVTVGGNMIRYPVAEGFALDYMVENTQLKQYLVIDERPVLEPNAAWFGFTEIMQIPAGHALFLGEDMLGEEITQTQESLDIRNIETGELLAQIPVPRVVEDGNEEYLATFFLQVNGAQVVISTVVESEWLLSDDRVFPIAIDPSISSYSSGGGDCYKYSNRCDYSTSRYMRYTNSGNLAYYVPWNRYTFTASSALPTGATVDAISHHQYTRSVYSWGTTFVTNGVKVSVYEDCGTVASSYGWTIPTNSCSGVLPASAYSMTSSSSNSASSRALIASQHNSAIVDSYSPSTGWNTADICTSAATCASNNASGYITAAQNATSTIGIGLTYTNNIYSITTNAGSSNSYIKITYSGGSDTDAPLSDFVPYTGVSSYIEGSRTFFTKLIDQAGIDTTAANAPTLNYVLNNGTASSVTGTSIGTCGSSASECRFSATIPTLSAGDYVEYYWKFQDLNPTANVGYDPVLTGTQTTPTPYYFAVEDVMDAGDDKKMTVLTTDVHAANYFSPSSSQFFDRQMTHYDGSDEYFFEFDVSTCGTGTNACWYSSSSNFYNSWLMQHTTVASTGYNGMGSSSQRSNLDEIHKDEGGYLTTNAKFGPGMNLLYHYDAGENAFAMVGIGSSPSISEKLTGGDSADSSYGYAYTDSFKITLGSDYGGHMGKFAFGNATGGAGTNANRLCVTSNGFTYFFRSTSASRDQCSGSYIYARTGTSYAWSGWSLGMSYYGRMAPTGDVTYKFGGVAPTPDTFAPDITHSALADSHSKSRTISAVFGDAGDPASGLNVSTTAGVGPTMYYRVTPDGGTAGSWTSEVMTPESGSTRAECVLALCTWSSDVDDLERGDSVEYYMTAQDVSTVATGINSVTTSTESFSVGDPNKMFIVEWRDMQYTNSGDRCTYQAVFYDVTNEIEFKYDDACTNSYDAATVGFMDQTRTKGQTIRHSTSTQYITGTNPHTNNYRISTDSGNGAWESFDRGLTGLVNADASAIMGSSGGTPTGYYCASGYYWNTWSSKCADNIPMPEGFNFTYFGTDYNYTDSNDRVNLGRHGNMHFVSNGATSVVRSMTTWYGNMPQLPYSSSSYARAGLIAPYWSYYGTYYCYQNTGADCGVYYRTMPFEGKGTDVTSDITQDTTWDLTDSPIRINPSSDYLSISADLTIEAGTVIQVGAGKGISFDGACDAMTINGNSSDHVLFEALDSEWLGMAFTDSCSTGTDDRHVFSYVDFKNTSDAAIAAGSRHGASPSSNGNVGNFTMDHVTFTDVGSAFSHGSGQGTVVSMTEFAVSGADNSCFDFAENSVVSLTEGAMTNCNTAGNSAGGAIVNVGGSTTGSLFLENTTISNAYVNLIDIDLQMVTVSNVTATATTAQTGDAIGSAGGSGSEVVLNNFDASNYATVSIDAMGMIMMTDVDFGTASMEFLPGGSASTSAAGASGDNAVFSDITAGNMMMRNLQPGTFDDVTVGDLTVSGDPASSDVVNMNNVDADVVSISGCGWNVIADGMTADRLSSNGCSAAANTVVMSDSTLSHSSATESAIYARYSDVTVGESAVTSTTAGNGVAYLALADTNSDIRLIAVTQNGSDCADAAGATGDCDVDVPSSSSEVWYGGLGTVRTYRLALVLGVPTQIFKSGHTVTASVIDGSSSELFDVGSHITDSAGSTSVWVVTGDESGNVYSDHNIRAFGPAGQNETMSSDSWYPTAGFTIGSSIDLLLEPAPVDFDQAGMDCAWMDAYVDPNNGAGLPTNGTTASGHTIFEFDGTPMTLSADLNLDGCKMILKGSALKVKSTATSSPVLTLSNGGSVEVTVSPDTGAVGAIRAFSSSYGLHMDIVSGSLILDGGILRDVAQDTSTGAALMVGEGATFTMMNSATVYGSSTSSDTMATVKVNGGTINVADSTIINTGQSGTALWVEAAGGSIDNIVVKNAAVGIQAYNGAPQVDGFTSTDNVVGVDVYGGMSLPTIYRSTLLSGQSTGWTTYKIDLSTFLANDYLQVGWNSIYGGGNAHPLYNYATSKYYMITDRYNIELEDSSGNAWNVTQSSDLGYYPYSAADPASGDGTHATYTAGASGGVPSMDCNTYGYHYGPNYPSSNTGYFYSIWQAWAGSNPGYPGYYQTPPQFGFDWENIEGVSPTGSYAYYPYHYWGFYYTSYHGGQGVYKPPEGYQGSYNVCVDYAYSYYMSAGQGARMTMPMVDISASNISKVSLYVDVLHNRADNFQDRLEVVARSSNSVSSLIDGEYIRESGTPLFKDGTITGADTGVSVGGAFAAAHFQDITVTNPTDIGLEISGQVASTTDGITVTGGDYGILVGNSASGSIDLSNIALDGQGIAGVYYAKDITGSLTGSVVNSAGAAFKYGPNTDNDVTFSGNSISSNAIGVETAGTGDIIMTDVTMANTKDVVISSSANVDFIEGTVDSTTVEVTGAGKFTRMRQLDVTLTADGNAVADATVTLIDGDGASAGNGVTDSLGVAEDLTYETATVDSNGLTTPSLAGYEVMSVAKVAYSYTSSTNNIADFRYSTQGVTLSDASGNVATVPLTTKVTERVCWYSTSSAYTTVAPCAGSFSTSGTRTLDDGSGGSVTEYGYYGGITTSQANKVIMVDSPYVYLKSGSTYDFNGSTILSTGAYDFYGTQRWYTRSPYGAELYMNDAAIYGVSSDDEGDMFGIELGYYGSPITTLVANNTIFSNIAKIEATNGYRSSWSTYNWEIDDISITNSTISHFQGYESLTNAIAYTDICMVLGGGDGAVISGNTFNNCGVGVMLQRSNYYSYHSADSYGADNATISDNVFNDGGEIADIWLYTNGYSDDAVITNNIINNADGAVAAIGVYNGQHTRTTISDNTINAGTDGIYISSGIDYHVTGNTINGASDAAYAGMSINAGYGDIDNNTLIDADGGLILDSASAPPAPTTALCSIASSSYSSIATCSAVLAAGKTMAVNVDTDGWGGEVSLSILKPDGSTDSWARYSFASNTEYSPLTTYTDAGTYVLTLRDSWGDGGTNVYMVEGGTAGGYTGPMIADNTISTTANRVAPAAVGLVLEDCSGVSINTARNTILLSDNAMSISNCDVSDEGSSLQGEGDSSTVGINADDANSDALSLSGTTISGFATGVEKTSGDLMLTGDASISGDDYGVYVDDSTVTAINAAVNGGTTGTGLHVVDSDDVWVYPMNASGLVGMYVENSPFRWDGGTSTASTALEVSESIGSIENMTWSASDVQIDAGSNAYVTSIGNTIDAAKLVVASSATIDEANLFTMDSTHLTSAPTDEVAMLIQSTDGTRASYVSTSFQPEIMIVDGSDADWNGGNALNPSGYAMPGMMSGDGTNDMMVTYIEGDDLYIGLTGEDLATSDVLIYLSVDGSGSSTGYNLGGAHTLPFQANYVLWADSADATGYALYSYGFLGWGPTTLSSANVDVASSSTLTEISIPFSRIGGTPSQIDIVAIVQGETTADVSTVHPTQTIDATNTLQSFNEYMTVELTHDDLLDGSIADEVLVYRSYKGSNTPSVAKNYDVMIKTEADCAYDWATATDLSLATNIAINLDMARACPEIQASLADVTVDEDSGAYTFSLTNMADDVQDLEVDLTWTSADGNIDAFDNINPVAWNQNGHQVTITPLDDQFGTLEYVFEVTDSNGLSDSHNITFEVSNVNDAPVICNVLDQDCMPIFSVDDSYNNILAEGFGTHTKFLGGVSNASSSYIRDMANEQSPDRQVYDWDAAVDSTCAAFAVEVDSGNNLVITENASNEKGGTCTVTLDLSDNGNENTNAVPYTVDFSVAPVNDAPVISLQDANSQNLLENVAGDRATGEGEYITMTEDDINADNLTWDLLPLMSDIDHDVPADLTWTVEPTSQCVYTNYFTTAIVGTDLVFTLIPDATTNGYDWEIDYMNDNGIHQLRPDGQTFCAINLVLKDTATAPSHTPNYDPSIMPIAAYEQGQDDVVMYVTIGRVAENVADYSIDAVSGVDFNGITNIMTGTFVPVSVNIDAGGDEGPYNYDHMLAVTFHTDGHDEEEFTRYYNVPAYGTSIDVNEDVYITKSTTKVEVSMDVLTCMNDPCDLTVPASERFQTDDPASHRSNNGGSQGSDWSAPGQFGQSAAQQSLRRPMLEDGYWCNNRLTTLDLDTAEASADWGKCNEYLAGSESFGATGQSLPNVVRTIGASAVPSFAPSIVVVSLTGLFVSALAFASRRADDEEEVTEDLEDNDMAVSPVIATILMVAITVVLSGVIYVWASSLADTDVKGVPRVTFDIEDIDSFDVDNGHWRITVQSAETDLATQAVEVRVFYLDGAGTAQTVTYNMADTNGVYGFNPANSDSMVTFVDQVNNEGDDKVSTFNTGDTVFVRTHDSDGTPLEDVTITLSYAPNVGQGAVLRSWNGLSYDLSA